MCEKCVFNVGFGSVGRENLQVSHGFTHSSRFPTQADRLAPHTPKIFVYFFPVHAHTHTHIAQCPLVSTRWWQQFNNQGCYRQMGTMASGFNILKRSTNTHSSYSNCRLMDYWWKEMSGRIFHPSLKTFRIGCLCQCSNFQQPSDLLWTNRCHDSRLYHQVLLLNWDSFSYW